MKGMIKADPNRDKSIHGQRLSLAQTGWHGTTRERLPSIITSRRLIRGGRGKDRKYGIFAAREDDFDTALIVLELTMFRSKSEASSPASSHPSE